MADKNYIRFNVALGIDPTSYTMRFAGSVSFNSNVDSSAIDK